MGRNERRLLNFWDSVSRKWPIGLFGHKRVILHQKMILKLSQRSEGLWWASLYFDFRFLDPRNDFKISVALNNSVIICYIIHSAYYHLQNFPHHNFYFIKAF